MLNAKKILPTLLPKFIVPIPLYNLYVTKSVDSLCSYDST